MTTDMQAFRAEQERLRQCYRDRDLEVKIEQERDPAMLAKFAHHPDTDVRHMVALNLCSDEATLRLLANDPSDQVRGGVAVNLNTPATVLRALAKEDFFWMRSSLARNPRCPQDIVQMLRESDIEAYESQEHARQRWLRRLAALSPDPTI